MGDFKSTPARASDSSAIAGAFAVATPQFDDLNAWAANMVFFVTNRETNPRALAGARRKVGEYEDYFLSRHGGAIVMGEVCVTHPLNRQVAEQNFDDKSEPDNPVTFFALKRPNTEPDSASFAAVVRDWEHNRYYQSCIAGNRFNIVKSPEKAATAKPLVYIHGWSASFKSAITRASQIELDLFRGPVLAIAWPSDPVGAPALTYLQVQQDSYEKAEEEEKAATFLVPLAIRILEAASGTPPAILAHSMGTRLYIDSLRKFREEKGEFTKNIEVAILAAPDVEKRYFEAIVHEISDLTGRFTIYCGVDFALFGSQIEHGEIRLGQCGPGPLTETAPEQFVQISGRTNDAARHSYFLSAPEMIEDMANTLLAGESAAAPKTELHYAPRQLQLR